MTEATPTGMTSAGPAEETHMDSPRSGVSGFSGLSARYRSFSPGGVVQSHQNQTMMLRSAALQLAGGAGKDDTGVVTRAMLKKNSEALEEKLARLLRRGNQEMSNTVDATFANVEKRISSGETVQKKLERRFAEVAGNWKGLSEEMQSQIRRSEQLDSRMGEVRRQVTEELRQRNMDFEQKLQKASSASRLANTNLEEQVRRNNQRLQVVESFLEERMKHEMEASETLGHLSARIAALEDSNMSAPEPPLTPTKVEEPGQPELERHPFLLSLQSEMKDVAEALERTAQETHELHAQLGAQEERLNTMRTLFEAKERALSDQSQSSEIEKKLELLRQQVHEKTLEKAEHADTLDVLQRKLISQEQAHEELRTHFLASKSRSSTTPVPCSTPRSGTPGNVALGMGHASGYSTPAGLPPAVPRSLPLTGQDMQLVEDSSALASLEARVEDTECRIGETVERIVARVEALQTTVQQLQRGHLDSDGTSHLLEQLKGVAPRIVEHDLQLKDHKQRHSGHQETLQEHANALSRIEKSVEELGNSHKSVHEDVKEEFMALWKECSDSTIAIPEGDQLPVLIREVSSALESCNALREELSQTRQEEANNITSEVSSAMQCLTSMQEQFKGLREDMSQELPLALQDDAGNITSEVRNAMKYCTDLQSELQSFRQELQTVSSSGTEAQSRAFDVEGRHTELQARVQELEAKASRLDAGASSADKEAIRAQMDKFERAMSDLGSHPKLQEWREQLLELEQRVCSCESAGGREGQEELSSRIRDVERGLQMQRSYIAEIERGLAEHRVSSAETERALVEYKAENERTLARSLSAGPQHGELSGRLEQFDRDLAEHRLAVTRQVEQGVAEQRIAAETVLAEHKAAVEQMLAVQRTAASDHGDAARRLEEFEKQLAEQRAAASSHGQTNDLAEKIDEVHKQLAEHRLRMDRAGDLAGTVEEVQKQLADHRLRMDRAGDLAGKVDEMQKELAEHRSQVDKPGDLGGTLEEVQKQLAEHRSRMDKTGDLAERFEQLEQQLEARSQVGDALDLAQRFEELEQQLEEQRSTSNQARWIRKTEDKSGDLAGRLDEFEKQLAEYRTPTSQAQMTGDLTGRLEEVEKLLTEHRTTALEVQQGLSEQRAAAETATAAHKLEVEKALAERLAVTQRALEDQRALTEKTLGEHKADVERALAEHRGAVASASETHEKALGEHKADMERALTEHRGAVAAAAPQETGLETRIQEAERALAEHKAAAPTQGHFQELERSHAALSDQIAKVGTSSEKVTQLAEKLADLESRVAKLAASPTPAADSEVQALGEMAEGEGEKLLQLIDEVSKDDEAEQSAHRSLLTRIDELCEKLQSVKGAADKGQLEANGVSPDEVSKQLQDANLRLSQSEEWQKRIEEQMKVMNEICSKLHAKPQDEEV